MVSDPSRGIGAGCHAAQLAQEGTSRLSRILPWRDEVSLVQATRSLVPAAGRAGRTAAGAGRARAWRSDHPGRRNRVGGTPVQRLKARVKLLTSEKPSR